MHQWSGAGRADAMAAYDRLGGSVTATQGEFRHHYEIPPRGEDPCSHGIKTTVAMEASPPKKRPKIAGITTLEERFANVEEQFTNVEEQSTNLEERSVNIQKRFANTEERLANVECVFQGVMENKVTEVDTLQQTLSIFNPKDTEKLACHQSVSSSFSKVVLSPAQINSFPANASSSNTTLSLNILPASTAADNPPAHSIQASSSTSSDFSGSLHEAAEKGDLPELRCWLADGEKVNARDQCGNTALHFAASNEQGTEVDTLQQKLSICNPKDTEKLACHQSVSSSSSKVVLSPAQINSFPANASSSNTSLSLNILPASTAADNPPAHSIQVSSSTSSDFSGSLLEAAEKGDLPELRCWLADGEKVNARDQCGNTALHFAASNGHTLAADVLIAHGAEVDSSGNYKRTPLHWAATNGHVITVARLVAAGASVNAQDAEGATAVGLAACEGHKAVVQLLLKLGASIHTAADNGETPLLMAVKNQRSGVVKALLENGASPTTRNRNGKSPLSLASEVGDVDLLKDLLENVQKSERGEIARSLSVAGSAEVVRLFADAAEDMVLGPAGEAACIALAGEGRQEALHALLQLGVDANATNAYGIIALNWAAARGQSSCVRTLLKAGAKVNVKDGMGKTALMLAANEECIVALTESGVV